MSYRLNMLVAKGATVVAFGFLMVAFSDLWDMDYYAALLELAAGLVGTVLAFIFFEKAERSCTYVDKWGNKYVVPYKG